MSAMFGIVRLDDQAVAPADIDCMAAAMDYRGPDGYSKWFNGGAGLGQLMLETTAEARYDKLPWREPLSGLVITADARIDNREELLAKLEVKGADTNRTGDSQLILQAYLKWGRRCVDHLVGEFAFAIWNSNDRTLFCARDHLGVKPFYFYKNDKALVFSSAVEGILALDWVPAQVNDARIADYLVPRLERIDKTSTFYQSIYRHPPAHIMTLERSRLATCQYWKMDEFSETRLKDDGEYAEAFHEMMARVILPRLRNVSGVGVSLSGGIDSGAIVGVGRQLMQVNHNDVLHTFSGVSRDDPNCGETQRLANIIAQGGVRATTVCHEQLSEMLDDLMRVPRATTDLFDNEMTLYPAMCIAARSKGVNIMLDGVDDVIMDNVAQYTAYQLRAGRWGDAWREISAISALSDGEISRASLLKDDLRTLVRSPMLVSIKRRMQKQPRIEDLIRSSIVNKELARAVDLPGRLDALRQNWPVRMLSSLRAANAAEINHPFLTVALERYDRIAARYAVEPRHPYMDKRFVEFCLALPWQQKDWRGWPKITLRRCMQGTLPEPSLWQQDRQHLGWRFTTSRLALLRMTVKTQLLGSLDELAAYVDVVKVRDAVTGFLGGKPTMLDEMFTWRALCLILWLRRQEGASCE